ncbi:MAG TPA: hypothetical protein PK580_00135 [Nitrosomonas halophila]|nr:hypothetical protein [Nitrosomonas halophila]
MIYLVDEMCVLFFSHESKTDLIKARGWWGPLRGGTHVKGSMHKEGKDGGGRSLSETFPDSTYIENQDQAKAYWREHFAGKTIPLVVHSTNKSKSPIPIKVRFDDKNDHAFTSDAGGKNKIGVRKFNAKRAKAMSRIVKTIEYPKVRVRNYEADLLFERNIGNEQFTVVLTWRPSSGVYEFHSSHFRSTEEVRRLIAHNDRSKNNGPLQKSEPSWSFGLSERTAFRSYPTGSQPVPFQAIGPNRNCNNSISKSAKKYKILFIRKRI